MQNITTTDIQRILSVAALAQRPTFTAELESFLVTARAVSRSPGVEGASFDASFTLGTPRVDSFGLHLCRSMQCGRDHLEIDWPVTVLAPSQVKRVLAGFHVVGESKKDEDQISATVMSPEAARHLDEFVEVTQALPGHDEIKALASSVRALLETADVPYLGFYLRVRPSSPAPVSITRIVFHWCLGHDCDEPAARGYSAIPHPGAVQVCGYSSDQLPRSEAPFTSIGPFANPYRTR